MQSYPNTSLLNGSVCFDSANFERSYIWTNNWNSLLDNGIHYKSVLAYTTN